MAAHQQQHQGFVSIGRDRFVRTRWEPRCRRLLRNDDLARRRACSLHNRSVIRRDATVINHALGSSG